MHKICNLSGQDLRFSHQWYWSPLECDTLLLGN